MNLSLIRIARRAVGAIWIALCSALVLFSLFMHVAPLMGHELYTITGGSMEPTIPLGSLVVDTSKDAQSVGVGDVITIRADNGVVITHRVTKVVDNADGRFFQLKGDANSSEDAGLVPARAVIGGVTASVPYAGYMRQFLSTMPGLIGALAALGALFLAYLLLGLLAPTSPAAPAASREPLAAREPVAP